MPPPMPGAAKADGGPAMPPPMPGAAKDSGGGPAAPPPMPGAPKKDAGGPAMPPPMPGAAEKKDDGGPAMPPPMPGAAKANGGPAMPPPMPGAAAKDGAVPAPVPALPTNALPSPGASGGLERASSSSRRRAASISLASPRVPQVDESPYASVSSALEQAVSGMHVGKTGDKESGGASSSGASSSGAAKDQSSALLDTFQSRTMALWYACCATALLHTTHASGAQCV